MPNGDVLVPDASLLSVATWTSLDKATQESYAPVILDVVAEIVSKTDRVSQIVAKCEGYHADGHRYVIMLDPIRKSVQAWGNRPRISRLPRSSSPKFCVERSYCPACRAVENLWISPTKRL
jgi:Uma2 family endonuclease